MHALCPPAPASTMGVVHDKGPLSRKGRVAVGIDKTVSLPLCLTIIESLEDEN